MIARGAALSLVLAATIAAGARAETTSIPAARDNTLFEDPTGSLSNGSGDALYVGDNSQSNTRRGLVYFDVAAALPPDAIVASAELRLVVASAPDSVPRSVAVHRALADWGEGTSASGGRGAPAQPGDATWLHRFFPDSTWAVAGGDFDATARATAVVGDGGTAVWSGAALAADVQAWLGDPTANSGWLLRGEEGQPQSARAFHSRESGDDAARPALVVEWHEPTAIRAATWAGLKGAHRDR